MSLINDVLRDLDARGAGAALPLPQGRPLAPASGAIKRGRLLVAALLLSAIFVPVGWLLLPKNQTPAALAAPLPSTLESPRHVESASEPKPPSASAATPAEAPSSTPAREAHAPTVVAHPAPVTSEAPAQPAPAAAPAPVRTTESTTAAATITASEPVTAPTTRVAHTANAAPDSARTLQQAATALSQGRDSEAEQLLRELLTRDPDAVRARQSLAALYQRQGRLDAALSLWRAGLARDAGNLELAEPLARALLANGQPAKAAQTLTTALPPLPQRSDLHALLAYAQQQAGDAPRAATTYRALLEHDDSQGRWWLGLAIAEESRGEIAAALMAFRRAQSAAGLESSVLRYVDQRIRALAPDPS